jgi:hypothetical protein
VCKKGVQIDGSIITMSHQYQYINFCIGSIQFFQENPSSADATIFSLSPTTINLPDGAAHIAREPFSIIGRSVGPVSAAIFGHHYPGT